MKNTKLRIGVTPAGFDDIGSILRQAGYSFSALSLSDLASLDRLRAFDVVFINCAQQCQGRGQTESAILRKYVADGGSLYASDYASDFVASAFGEYITFGNFDGRAEAVQAEVVDPGLQATLGKTAKLVFDMGGWRTIAAAKSAQVHLALQGSPILVSFDHGNGHVVFTCFHNHKALSSEAEAGLLNYLILKPLTAQASLRAKQGVQIELSREFMFSLSQGETSAWYEYPAIGGEPLVFALSWHEQAQGEIVVHGSDGKIQQQSGTQSPVQISIPMASGGIWRAQAHVVNSTVLKLAMHLLIGPARPSTMSLSSGQTEPLLDIRVHGATTLPITVLSQQPLVPLPIRRLDED